MRTVQRLRIQWLSGPQGWMAQHPNVASRAWSAPGELLFFGPGWQTEEASRMVLFLLTSVIAILQNLKRCFSIQEENVPSISTGQKHFCLDPKWKYE